MPTATTLAAGLAVAEPAYPPEVALYGLRRFAISHSEHRLGATGMDAYKHTQAPREVELQPVRAAMAAAMAGYFNQHAARIAAADDTRQANQRARAAGSPKRPMPAPLPPLGILATVGLGKSVGVTPLVGKAHAAGLPLVILVPTHQLAQEYSERLKPWGAVVYQGRREPSESKPNEAPCDPGAHACYRLERVADASDQNHRPAQGLCCKCPSGHAGVLTFVTRDEMRIQRATEFFKTRGMDPAKTPPCQFLFRGLPDQLAAPILVAPIAAFSEAMADWREVDPMSGSIMRQAQRLIVVDEHIPMAREVEIDAGDVRVWRNRLDGLLERLEKTITSLGKKNSLTSVHAEELRLARLMRDLVPDVDKLFRDIGAQIAGDQPLDAQRVIDMQKRVTKAGGSIAGTAKWERVSYSHEDDDFFIPLRALSTLANNCKAWTMRQEKGTLFAYETNPVIEHARDKGSVIFLDATMSLAMRQFIQSRGGRIHEATASQNMHVTRMTGHLYARGDVKKATYPDEARAHMEEIRDRIAPQLSQPAAIITHMAYLRYSQEAHQADDASQVAAQQFEADTGVPIGWFGRHDRGLDCWGGRNLALVGMTFWSETAFAGLYAATRAALADCDIQWPAWDKAMDKDRPDADGPPLPVMPEVRAWLIDEYAQNLAQGIGRNRAVNRPMDAEPLQVHLWGGIQTAEMDEALAKYGVVIHERKRNPRSISGPKVDQGAVDEAIATVQGAGGRVSERSVRAALIHLRRSASTESIRLRLRALSEELSPTIPVERFADTTNKPVGASEEVAASSWTDQRGTTTQTPQQGQEKMAARDGNHAWTQPTTCVVLGPLTAPNPHKDTNSGNSAQSLNATPHPQPPKQGQETIEKILFAPAFDLMPDVDEPAPELAYDEIEDMLQQVARDIESDLAQELGPDEDPDPHSPGGRRERQNAHDRIDAHHSAPIGVQRAGLTHISYNSAAPPWNSQRDRAAQINHRRIS
ncbi:hypothetical protein [Thiomonas sp.]